MKLKIEVVAGVAGPSLYINDTRIAGPKPWGGGKTSHSWTCDSSALNRAIAAARKERRAALSGERNVGE